MKLLIVDDEALTREGLISSLNWEELHIQKIYQADDGQNGLDLAKRCCPDIILSDVRMPRMDGIQMAQELSELLPDTAIIFMSGYSDKAYLKAAIRLKAVSYVEKPLNPGEIREAVLEAVLRIEEARSRRLTDSQKMTEKLALVLTQPWNGRESLPVASALFEELFFPLTDHTFFTSMIVKLRQPLGEAGLLLGEICGSFCAFLAKYGLCCVCLIKHECHVVFHVFGAKRSPEGLRAASHWLLEHFQTFDRLFVAVGNTVSGVQNAYGSYISAVILIQSSFFYDYGSILENKGQEDASGSPGIFQDPLPGLAEALSSKNEEETLKILDQVYAYFRSGHELLPNQVRDIYYQLFLCLQDACAQAQLGPAADPFRISGIMALMEECENLTELHQTLCRLASTFFSQSKEQPQDTSTTFMIKDFIARHYKNSTLSVKDISEHVYLSASYVCTLFKSETGQTLNQYITEYRMEKAKKLLSDPRYKIADISAKVGYADGNYFGKSFKKMVGLSPSEYREKILK